MGTNEYYMPSKPTVRLHPPVYSAMSAFTQRTGKPDHRDEKGFLLVGQYDAAKLVADVQGVIIFPQKGNGTAVDFDNDHPHTPKFWPAVHDYLTKNDLKLLGWAHYYSGGVHHSHTDNFTDDVFSFALKDGAGTPLMISMTWNEDKAGVEGKLWGKVGEHDVQLTFQDLPIEYVTPNQGELIERFLADLLPKTKVTLAFDFDGIVFEAQPKDIGTTADALQLLAIADMRTNLELYLRAKNAGDKLKKRISSMSVDAAVVAETHAQLDKLWKPFTYSNTAAHKGSYQSSSPTSFPGGGDSSGKESERFFPGRSARTTPTQGRSSQRTIGGSSVSPTKDERVQAAKMAREVVYKGTRHVVLLEDEVAAVFGGVDQDTSLTGGVTLLIVDKEYERKELLTALRCDSWNNYRRRLMDEAEVTAAFFSKQAAWKDRAQ